MSCPDEGPHTVCAAWYDNMDRVVGLGGGGGENPEEQ